MSQGCSRREVLGTAGRLLSAGALGIPLRLGSAVPRWRPCPLSFADSPAALRDLSTALKARTSEPPDTAVAGSYPAPEVVPLIHSRSEWGALPPKRAAQVLPHGPDHIVVHHTDSPNSADTSLAHAFELSRSIQRFHMFRRGWDDIGQQLTITRGGHVLEGRNRSLPSIMERRLVVGAQTMHQNDHTLGIENEGTYMTAPVAPLLWTSLVKVCGWLCTVYELDPQQAIVGHRDFMSTDCPGDVLYGRLPELRRAVAQLIAGLR